MLTGLHILLTYQCTNQCPHCFVFGSPRAGLTFTGELLHDLYRQADELPTLQSICFEGGEPFLYYSLMLNGIAAAKGHGWQVGVVTNAFWAVSPADAVSCLQPLLVAGLTSLTLSDDALHDNSPQAQNAFSAAKELGLKVSVITTRRGR